MLPALRWAPSRGAFLWWLKGRSSMEFIEASRAVGFPALLVYVAIVVLAHLLRWKRFNHMHALGVVVGAVCMVGLAAQFGLEGFIKYALMGVAVALGGYLFGRLGNRLSPRSR